MLGTIRLLLRFVWLAIMVLGAKRLLEAVEEGLDQVIAQAESGETQGVPGALHRLHDALHRGHGHGLPNNDAAGEM
ncbi:MAG: hypothetical protein OXI25_08015 [Chloroflexota bacterium]|nr:hypothetical protein [Chloroflexota bacterium]